MTLLTVAFGLFAQDAEELYRKFEKKIAEAKSVSLAFRVVEVEDPMSKAIGKKLVHAGKARISEDQTAAEIGERSFAAKNGRLLAVATARVGWSLGTALFESKELDPDQVMKLSNFSVAEGSMIGVKVISYDATFGDKKMRVSLWLDTEKMLPMQRRVKIEGDPILYGEHYSDFTVE